MSRTTQQTLKVGKLATSPRPSELGICTTCNHAPACVNLKASGRPIWYCDQFDTYVPASVTAVPAADRSPEPVLATNGGHEGLCQNCDNRKTCINRAPGIAIWDCEEHC